MTPGKLYISVSKVSIGIWSMAGTSVASKLLDTIKPGEPFVFIGFGQREIPLASDNIFVSLKVLNHDGVVGFTSFLPLDFFKEAREQ